MLRFFRHLVSARRPVSIQAALLPILLPLATTLVASPAPGQSDFRYPEPDSPVYREWLLAGARDVKVSKDSRLVGNVYAGGTLDLDQGAEIDGDATAVRRVQGGGTVTGTTTENAPALLLPAMPSLDELRAVADRVLDGDQKWDDVVIDDVVFVDGKVEIRGSLDGRGTLIAARDLKVKKGPSSLEPSTYLAIVALGKVDIDKDRRLRGLIRATRDVKLDQNVEFEGVIVADGKVDLAKDGVYRFLPPDRAPPAIEIVSPVEGALLADSTPTVEALLSDSGRGLDLASIRLSIDGIDIGSGVTITGDSASATLLFTPSTPLAEGPHRVELFAADQAGNESALARTFAIDSVAPTVSFLAPAEGALLVNQSSPTIRLALSDPGSGVGTGSGVAAGGLRLRDGGRDLSLTCTVGPGEAVCQPPRLDAGVRLLTAEVRDLAGNVATAQRSFEILLDGQAPTLSIVEPTAGTLLNPIEPLARLAFDDGEAGIDLASLRLLLDGVAVGCTPSFVDGRPVGAECPLGSLGAGGHVLEAQISDRAGRQATASVGFQVLLDSTAPILVFELPDLGGASSGSLALDEPSLEVALRFADVGAGIDPASLSLTLDGASALADCTFETGTFETGTFETDSLDCRLPVLSGSRVLRAQVADRAGNATSARLDLDLVVDDVAPSLEIVRPSGPLADGVDSTTLELRFSDTGTGGGAGSGLDLDSLSISLGGRQLASDCTVGTGSALCELGGLGDGQYAVVARLADRAGNRARTSGRFSVQAVDRQAPVLTITQPAAGPVTGISTAIIEAVDPSGVDPSSLLVQVDGLDATSTCTVEVVDATSSRIECSLRELVAGPHDLAVQVRDGAGNRGTAQVAFDLELQVPVSIDEPASGLLTRSDSVTLRGSSVGAATVSLGDQTVDVAADGSWQLTAGLHEGGNTLTVLARSAVGGVGTATVDVVLDTEAPRPVIRTPPDGLVTTSGQVAVAGDVLTPSSSGTRLDPPEVRVGGLPAAVEQRTFFLDSVLLVPGENVIEVDAFDTAGNQGRDQVTVTYLARPSSRLEELQGNGQRAVAGQRLEQPLVVRAVDVRGVPLAGRQVRFEVTRGDGRLIAFPEETRSVRVVTDEQGLAQVDMVLGRRSGDGLHEVTASAPGLDGAVVFCASAEPTAAHRIVRVVGDIHLGALTAAADAEAPFPFLAQVFDRVGNPLPGVDVTFSVVEGSGHFPAAEEPRGTRFVARTDAEGRASARFVLGPETGIDAHRIEATFAGNPGSPARFAVSGVLPGPEAETTLVGLVLDNQDQPVPGATIRLREAGLETVSGSDGQFELTSVPVGTIDMEVDGTTTPRAGRWPVLHYVFDTISGHRNELGMPVRLLPLEDGYVVGGSEDVTIPIVGVAGGELTVFADSVTFPDGSRVGEVAITQVHGDKVPMLPPLGSSFMLAWTVQPPGARFDPPARISIPNIGGESPGTVVDIFSFDHDLGEFVPIGTATVAQDGTRVVSDRGSGVVEAGWHGCVPPPSPPSDACSPSACRICQGDSLVPKCDVQCQTCDGGTCNARKIESVKFQVEGNDGEDTDDVVVLGVDQEADFEPILEGNCRDYEYDWSFGDGESSSARLATHEYDEEGEYRAELRVRCQGCSGDEKSHELTIRVIEVDLEIQELPDEDEDGVDEHEEEPGAFLFVNDDDDNDNQTDDLDESSQVEGEDDLVEAKITISEEDLDQGVVRLDAVEGGEALLVWTTEDKAEAVELPKEWDLGDGDELPESVWIEATESSTRLRDIELVLSLEAETIGDPIEDKVMITSIDLEFSVSPSEADQTWEDDIVAPAGIGAALFFRDFDDPEKLRPVADDTELEWSTVAGSGSIESRSLSKDGFAPALATLPQSPGGPYRFQAKLAKLVLPDDLESQEIETEQTRETNDIEVVVGAPASIDIQPATSTYPDDEQTETVVTATVVDAHGHAVADGTPIAWEIIAGQGVVVRADDEVFGGTATATILGEPWTDSQHVLEVTSGEVAETYVFGIQTLTAELSSSQLLLDAALGETALVTLQTNAGDGTPVEWAVGNAGASSDVSQVVGGSASITISAAGATPGPVTVGARVADRIVLWQGEIYSSAPTTLRASSRALISDRTETGLANLRLKSGKVVAVPELASTTLSVRGPSGGSARAAFQGARLAEALRFDNEVGGIVQGEVAGSQLELADAVLDTTLAYRGGASARTLGLGPMRLGGDAVPTFDREMLLSFWVRPEVVTASTLAAQGTAWGIELLDDGRVRARVGSAEVVSETALVEDEWQQISLLVEGASMRLNVESSTVSVATSAPSLASTASIELGEGFVGHIDEVSFHDQAGQLRLAVPRGIDALGFVELDEAGEGQFELRSRGQSLDYFDIQELVVQVATAESAAELFVVEGVLSAETRLAMTKDGHGTLDFAIEVIKVFGEETGRDLVAFIDAFTGGEPDTLAGWVGALVGGTLGIADIGALVREFLKLTGVIEGEFQPLNVLLAIVGIVSTPLPGGDQGVTIARILVQKAAGSPLLGVMREILEEVVRNGFRFSDEILGFLRSLNRVPSSVLDNLKANLTKANWSRIRSLQQELGDDILEVTSRVIDQVPGGAVAGRKMLRYLDETPEAVEVLKQAKAAGQFSEMYVKMTRMVSRGAVGPGIIMKVIGNCKHLCSEAYPPWKLIDDMAEVSADLTGEALDAFKSFSGRLRQGFGTTPPNQTKQVLGNRYELEVARGCKDSGGVVRLVSFFTQTAVGNTDIDVLCIRGGVGQLIQAKRGPRAFKSADDVEDWVLKANAYAKENPGLADEIDIRYSTPDPNGVDSEVVEKLRELLGPDFEIDPFPSAPGGLGL